MSNSKSDYDFEAHGSVGALLKQLRERRGFSQEMMVKLLEQRFSKTCTQQKYSRYENGYCKQPMLFVAHCCFILNIHPLTFFMCIFAEDSDKQKTILGADPGKLFLNLFDQVFNKIGPEIVGMREFDCSDLAKLASYQLSTDYENNMDEHEIDAKMRKFYKISPAFEAFCAPNS